MKPKFSHLLRDMFYVMVESLIVIVVMYLVFDLLWSWLLT